MPSAIYGAFFCTVALLVTTGYFLMGGLPLLILKHDVPVDAKFIRGFFNVYYRAAFWTALGACLSYALWGRLSFALGAAAVAAIATVLRRRLVPAMEQLGTLMEQRDADAIERFAASTSPRCSSIWRCCSASCGASSGWRSNWPEAQCHDAPSRQTLPRNPHEDHR